MSQRDSIVRCAGRQKYVPVAFEKLKQYRERTFGMCSYSQYEYKKLQKKEEEAEKAALEIKFLYFGINHLQFKIICF